MSSQSTETPEEGITETFRTPEGITEISAGSTPEVATLSTERKPRSSVFLPKPKKTKPWVWCVAGTIFILGILFIFVMLSILFIRPKTPSFDIENATLNSPNLDLMVVWTFKNRNKKIKLQVVNGLTLLYFKNYIIVHQVIEPFKNFGSQDFVSNLKDLPAEIETFMWCLCMSSVRFQLNSGF